jgi:prepilin-type N-terminal cleavage/methylation domain-containing protein
MTLSRNPSRPVRGGFTLIELLVVIAIISILMALTAAAVFRTLGVGPRVKTRTEIGQLDGGVEAFKLKYKVDMVPSRLALRKYYQDYNLQKDATGNPKNPLDFDSYNYLTTIFPGLARMWQTRGINWHTDPAWMAAAPGTPAASEILEGDQCLVFFLGGIQAKSPNGCLGFSIDSANPDKPGGERVSFFDFNSARLITLPRASKAQSIFFSYVDGYGSGSANQAAPGVPYAYFASYAIDNNYNRYGSTDCPTLKVWPYAVGTSPTRYLRPQTFQIISAGADQKFGPGSVIVNGQPSYLWTTGTAAAIDPSGADDMANFSSGILSNGPQ